MDMDSAQCSQTFREHACNVRKSASAVSLDSAELSAVKKALYQLSLSVILIQKCNVDHGFPFNCNDVCHG